MLRYLCLVLVFCVQSASAADVEFDRNAGQPLNAPNGIIAVKLMSYSINRVSRPDLIGKNEGEVLIEFGANKNQTRLFWSGQVGRQLHFQYNHNHNDGILLYFGRIADLAPAGLAPLNGNPNWLNCSLPFHVTVTEDDEGDDIKWQKAAEDIKKIGAVAEAFPPYGIAADAGIGFVGNVVSFFSKIIHRSTTELDYEGDFFRPHPHENPLNICGDYTLQRRNHHDQNISDIELNFRLDNFPIIQNPIHSDPPQDVRIILESLTVPSRIAAKIAKGDLLTAARGLVSFEVKVNTESSIKHSVYPETFKEEVFKLQDALMYKGPWINTGVPVSISLVYTKEDRKLEDLVSSLTALTKAVVKLPGVNPPDSVVPVLNTLQTTSSIAIASVKPESQHSLFSLGIELIINQNQTIRFPMYSPKGQTNLGDIEAHIIVLPG